MKKRLLIINVWLACCCSLCSGCLAQNAPTVTPKTRALYNFLGQIHWLAFRPNSTEIAVGLFGVKDGGKAIVCRSWIDKAVKDATLDTMASPCFCVAYDSDGSRLAWCSWTPGKQIRIQGRTGGPKTIDCGKVNITAIAFDPGSKSTIASTSTDGIVRIWSTDSRKLIRKLPSGNSRGLCVAYSPDGRYLASSYRNNQVRLWRNDGAEPDPTILDSHTGQVDCLAFSPDSRRLATASADKSIILWDCESGKRVRSLGRLHLDPVTCFAFSPNGKYLATGDRAGKVVFWSMENYRPLSMFYPHRDPVYTLAISSDGDYLATGSQDRSVKVYKTHDLGYMLGHVRIVSKNGRVTAKVDGAEIDVSDNYELALSSGAHVITITTLDGSNSKSYPVVVASDTETALTVDISSALGKLIVASSESSDVAVTGGAETSHHSVNEPIERLSPGRYTVTITPKKRKYVPQVLSVEIRAAETARVSVSLQLAAGDSLPPSNVEALLQTRTNPRDGAEMVWIPAGTFTMGRKTADRDARPPRTLTLSGYWIYRYPVTVAQYRKFCDATAGTHNERRMPAPPKWGWIDDHPIVLISWRSAADYGMWAFGTTHRTFLPTEAQYERAMQGSAGTEYPWGENFFTDECINSIRPNHPIGTASIGSKSPNSWGLYDMAGNVWEWCADWYDADAYRRTEGSEAQEGRQRSVRGGAWDTRNSKMFRTDYRSKADPSAQTPNTGFRCAAG